MGRFSHKGPTDIKSLETTAVHDYLKCLIHSDHPGQPEHLSHFKLYNQSILKTMRDLFYIR